MVTQLPSPRGCNTERGRLAQYDRLTCGLPRDGRRGIRRNDEVPSGAPLLHDRAARITRDDVPSAIGGPPYSDVGYPVAVVVPGNGNISALSPLLRDRVARTAARDDVPNAIGGPPDGEVRLSVAVVVAWHGYVSLCAPLLNNGIAWVAAGDDEPCSGRRPPDGEVRLSITIVVAWHWYISLCTPLLNDGSAWVAAGDHIPNPLRRPPYGDVGFAITIKVPESADAEGGHCDRLGASPGAV